MELDPDKQECVRHMRDHSVTVVTAGAGAGKTYTIVACLLDVMEHHAGSLDQCALITFTNHGADELRARVEDQLAVLAGSPNGSRWREQQERLSSAFIGTIHGFCSTLLRTYGFAERVARSASTTTSAYLQRQALVDVVELALTSEEPPPATEAIADLDLAEHEVRRVLFRLASYCRSRGVDLEQLASLTATEVQPDGDTDAGRDARAAIADALVLTDRSYAQRKQQDGIVDVDDLLLATARMLRNERHGPELRRRIAQRFPYLFVDEFQDTNPVQEAIIDALQPELKRLVVVGDVKQAIFAFLAATPRLLQGIAAKYHVDPCPLTYAQRPTLELLRVQRALFDSIRAKYDIVEQLEVRDDMPEPTWDDLPPLRYRPTESDDADLVRDTVVSLIDDSGVPASEIAIIAATNRELLELEEILRQSLQQRGIGLQRDGGGLFGTPEVIGTYQTLRVIADEHDEASLFEALGTPYMAGTDVDDAIGARLRYGATAPPISDAVAGTQAGSMLDLLRDAAHTETVAQLLTRLFDASGIVSAYEAAGAIQQAANLLRLREYARELTRSEQALTLSAFIEHLRLAIELGFDEPEARIDIGGVSAERVRLSTIHGAKGLEWPVVVLPGMGRVLNARWRDPDFILEEAGSDRSQAYLDINLRRVGGESTASPRWDQRLRRVRKQDVEEQFRLLYVAVTRAKQSVVLVGGSGEMSSGESVTWSDEVLRARPALQAAGAVFDNP
jgi:ATP-dependent exoDNAse (exonuclease V) beta subunit